MALPIGSFPCRFCGTPLVHTFADLGATPLCESFVPAERYAAAEPIYPLHAFVCHECLLVQVDSFVPREEIFGEYAYFSSFSDSWVDHARRYAEAMIERLGLGPESTVVEVASNDGYLLQHFVARRVPCYGIEPAANVAAAALDKGVPTEIGFFGRETARALAEAGRGADLLAGKNVLAQVPDLHDFVAGLKILLNPGGTVTIEFPHLLRTMEGNQFDQIYHEHFCYFSFLAAERIFAHHGLALVDVEEVPTHGGSLRIFARHVEETPPVSMRVGAMRAAERAAGLERMATYAAFADKVVETKCAVLDFLIAARRGGKTVAGYGAPGKGNTLLNYCGVTRDLFAFTVDRNPYKQGRFLPGSRIPIHAPERIAEARPDYVVIMPWNLREEIAAQLAHVAGWGGKLVVFIPEVEIFAPASSARSRVVTPA